MGTSTCPVAIGGVLCVLAWPGGDCIPKPSHPPIHPATLLVERWRDRIQWMFAQPYVQPGRSSRVAHAAPRCSTPPNGRSRPLTSARLHRRPPGGRLGGKPGSRRRPYVTCLHGHRCRGLDPIVPVRPPPLQGHHASTVQYCYCLLPLLLHSRAVLRLWTVAREKGMRGGHLTRPGSGSDANGSAQAGCGIRVRDRGGGGGKGGGGGDGRKSQSRLLISCLPTTRPKRIGFPPGCGWIACLSRARHGKAGTKAKNIPPSPTQLWRPCQSRPRPSRAGYTRETAGENRRQSIKDPRRTDGSTRS